MSAAACHSGILDFFSRKPALPALCLLHRPFAPYPGENQMSASQTLGFLLAFFLPQTRTSCSLSAPQTVCSLSRRKPNVCFADACFSARVFFSRKPALPALCLLPGPFARHRGENQMSASQTLGFLLAYILPQIWKVRYTKIRNRPLAAPDFYIVTYRELLFL